MLREAYRVLKPGGRFAVSDVVTRGAVPEALRRDMLLWVGCIAGALDEDEYRAKLDAAGFQAVTVEPTRVYRIEDAREFLTGKGVDVDAVAPLIDGKFMSAFVRASKPHATKDASSARQVATRGADPCLIELSRVVALYRFSTGGFDIRPDSLLGQIVIAGRE